MTTKKRKIRKTKKVLADRIHTSTKIYIGIVLCVILLLTFYGGKLIGDGTPINGEVTSVLPTIALITVQPTVTVTPTPQPFLLHLSAYDYSYGDPNNNANGNPTAYKSVTGASVRLYDSTNTLIGEQKIPASNPPVVAFAIPFGSYHFEATTDTLMGKGDITIQSHTNTAYYAIYLYAKPMYITGRFFIDSNRNNQYDPGEQTLANQTITAYHVVNGNYYTSATATTDSNGNYNFTLTNYSGTYQIQPPMDLPYAYPNNKQVTLTGGQRIGLDLYVWPH